MAGDFFSTALLGLAISLIMCSILIATEGVNVRIAAKFDAVKNNVGIVTTKWVIERPMIFEGSVGQAHGRVGTFAPGFGCTIGDAVQASCSAYPFFDRKIVTTHTGDDVELIDSGYCAKNPTLYAIADALVPMQISAERLRVVNVGVGVYPSPKPPFFSTMRWTKLAKLFLDVELLQKTMEINTQSMDQLRTILFKQVKTERISDTFEKPAAGAEEIARASRQGCWWGALVLLQGTGVGTSLDDLGRLRKGNF